MSHDVTWCLKRPLNSELIWNPNDVNAGGPRSLRRNLLDHLVPDDDSSDGLEQVELGSSTTPWRLKGYERFELGETTTTIQRLELRTLHYYFHIHQNQTSPAVGWWNSCDSCCFANSVYLKDHPRAIQYLGRRGPMTVGMAEGSGRCLENVPGKYINHISETRSHCRVN